MYFYMPVIIFLVTENYVGFCCITYQHKTQLVYYYKVFPNYALLKSYICYFYF